jgi:hypothetical protein
MPAAVRLAAGITDAIPLVPTKIEAGSAAPFHCTTEQGDKLLPFTVNATGGPVNASSAAFEGEIELIAGAGRLTPDGSAVTGSLREFELVPGLAPETVMAAAAAPVLRNAVSAGVIAALSCVALRKVVARGEPFQLTTSPFAKPVPVTIRLKPVELQNGVLLVEVVDAESAVMVGRPIGNDTALDVFALETGVATVTCAVPTEARSAAGTAALSCAAIVCVAPIYVVASGVVALPLVHCTTEHGRRFAPVTITVAPAAPAVAPVGEIEVIVGAAGDAAEIVKASKFDTAPELDTSTSTVPAEAMYEGTTGAGFVTHSTTEPFTKLLPVTVSVTPEALHDGVVFDEVVDDDKAKRVGGDIVNDWEAGQFATRIGADGVTLNAVTHAG